MAIRYNEVPELWSTLQFRALVPEHVKPHDQSVWIGRSTSITRELALIQKVVILPTRFDSPVNRGRREAKSFRGF